jgi:integrase
VAAVPRQPKGEVQEHCWKDGRTITWRLRISWKGRRIRVNLGTNHEGWHQQRADVELERVMGLVERGTWEPPKSAKPEPQAIETETLRVTATRYYERRKKEGLEPKTEADYEWRLSYILSYKPNGDSGVPTDGIDAVWFDDFRDWLVGIVSEQTGRPLSSRSVNMILAMLAAVLDDAVRYKLLPANPARGPKQRLKEERKRRPILEPDMVLDLLEAAGKWEDELRKRGQRHQCFGRRALLAFLILAGPRISEATGLERSNLDIHGERARIEKSKTEAGERDIDLTAFLLGELRPHLAASPSLLGHAPSPSTPVFHSYKGGPVNDNNFRNRVLPEIVKRANKKRAKEGKLLIPEDLTPHAFRRTFARLCFMAGRELDYVMGQIGHKDATLAVEIYAQMRKGRTRRKEREIAWKLMRFNDEGEMFGEFAVHEPLPVA